MIKIGNKIIEQGQFGDGTLKCEVPVVAGTQSSIHVTWCYDNDSELFTLWCLIKSIKEINPNIHINMSIPYIPHARQDRNVSGRLFTLCVTAKQWLKAGDRNWQLGRSKFPCRI